MRTSRYRFDPVEHEDGLVPIIEEILAQDHLDAKSLHRIVRKYPKDGRGAFSKSDILRAYRLFRSSHRFTDDEASFREKVRMKPIKGLSEAVKDSGSH